jgi:hypothetical protein
VLLPAGRPKIASSETLMLQIFAPVVRSSLLSFKSCCILLVSSFQLPNGQSLSGSARGHDSVSSLLHLQFFFFYLFDE